MERSRGDITEITVLELMSIPYVTVSAIIQVKAECNTSKTKDG